MNRLEAKIAGWLERGIDRIGEVVITRHSDDRFLLRHADDVQRDDLEEFRGPESAREIAADDDHGDYRPLKTAPSLRHGWQLQLDSFSELRLALDFFYPGVVALAAAQEEGTLEPTPLRETLNRQTGMYRITATIDNDSADRVVSENCALHNCRRRILWSLENDRPLTKPPAEKHGEQVVAGQWSEGRIPLICREACCLLVGAIRKEVKSRKQKK